MVGSIQITFVVKMTFVMMIWATCIPKPGICMIEMMMHPLSCKNIVHTCKNTSYRYRHNYKFAFRPDSSCIGSTHIGRYLHGTHANKRCLSPFVKLQQMSRNGNDDDYNYDYEIRDKEDDEYDSDYNSYLSLLPFDELPPLSSYSSSLSSSSFSSKEIIALTRENKSNNNEEKGKFPTTSRRIFMGLTLTGISTFVAGADAAADWWHSLETVSNAAQKQKPSTTTDIGALAWTSTPVNKRTGVTVFDAENAGYNIRFVTYLSRFLLVFDNDCQRWWYSKAQDIPILSTADQVQNIRLKQFGAFAASVEVGLQEYQSTPPSSEEGPSRLMKSLLARYCQSTETIQQKRELRGLPPMTEQEESRERRQIKEARRQIALLFGLLESTQPVEQLNKLLASIDNGSIATVIVQHGGNGYAPGYGPPRVVFPQPKAGNEYVTATGRAVIKPNGQILRIDLQNRGIGYTNPPKVVISAPGEDRGITIPGTKGATGKAFVFKKGPNRGRLEKILIQESGTGYVEGEKIRINISPPELEPSLGGIKATAVAILEYSVTGIEITNPGNGYAVEKQIPIIVDPPPLTARVNMNDPLMARLIDPSKPLPLSTFPTANEKRKIASNTNSSDPNSFTYRMANLALNDGKGGGGGCIGRACYDEPVVAFAVAKAESSSFTTFRNENDARKIIEDEEALIRDRAVSAATGGPDSQLPSIFWNGGPSSSSFLTLLPPGLGLEYDSNLKRFVLSASSEYRDIDKGPQLSGRPLDPQFGPRGRSPIDREVQLDFSSYLRFCVSGAICASGVHLMVTPLDVIKTKIQTDPKNYPGPISAFKKLISETDGLKGFFIGWSPTFIGFFLWGGFSYSLTELLRRTLIISYGSQAQSLEIQIILVSSAVAAFFGSFVLVPFESVRIRSVAQPGYGKNILDVTSRIISEEGVGSLFSAIPPFLLKEVPFNMAKFAVFTFTTQYIYQTFPAAQEDIQLSLLVSLVGGIFGGAVAAVVSNPADATISEMKKNVSDLTPFSTAKQLIENGGYANLFRGLPIRMAFYPLVVSTQFLVYDAIRIYLGVGSDDLKVYLDVLGGALRGEPY